MEQIGFDFVYPLDVECKYCIEKPSCRFFKEEVIKIKNFRSNIISKKLTSEEN